MESERQTGEKSWSLLVAMGSDASPLLLLSLEKDARACMRKRGRELGLLTPSPSPFSVAIRRISIEIDRGDKSPIKPIERVHPGGARAHTYMQRSPT